MNNSTIYFSSFSFSAIPLQLLDSANWRNPYYYSFGVFFLKQNGTTGIAVFFNTNIGNTPVTQITIKTESGELVPVNFSDTSVQETVNPFAGNIRNRENRSQVFIPANDNQRYFIHTMPEKIRFTINGQIIDEIIPPDMKAAFRQMAIFYQSPEFQR